MFLLLGVPHFLPMQGTLGFINRAIESDNDKTDSERDRRGSAGNVQGSPRSPSRNVTFRPAVPGRTVG